MRQDQDDNDFSLHEAIGLAVWSLRLRYQLTQQDLAAKAEVTVGVISIIEDGKKNSLINIEALHKVAKVLHLSSLSTLIALAEKEVSIEDAIMQLHDMA